MRAFVHSTIQAFVLLSVALSFIIFVKAIPEIITYYPALHPYLVPEGVTSTTVTSVRHCRVSHNGSLQPTGTSTQLTTPTQFCTRPSTKAAKQRPSGPQHHALRLPPRDDRLSPPPQGRVPEGLAHGCEISPFREPRYGGGSACRTTDARRLAVHV